jgi:cell division protein ZapB
MNNDSSDNVKDFDLKTLEARVEQLIALCERLSGENRLLRDQLAQIAMEKDKLMEKNDLAKSHVESILTRLRTLEHDA